MQNILLLLQTTKSLIMLRVANFCSSNYLLNFTPLTASVVIGHVLCFFFVSGLIIKKICCSVVLSMQIAIVDQLLYL